MSGTSANQFQRADLTVREVADILRVNRETVRQWIQAGIFPQAYALPHGAGWRVPAADVEALRERGRVHPSQVGGAV